MGSMVGRERERDRASANGCMAFTGAETNQLQINAMCTKRMQMLISSSGLS